jgi:carboxypeptidase Q
VKYLLIFQKHSQNLQNTSVILNSDYGTFRPFGLTLSARNTRAQCIVYQVLQLLHKINATELVVGKSYDLTQSDGNEFMRAGIPASGLLNDNTKHWYYSHTNADTMSAINPYYLDLCSIVWTAASYVLADLTEMLPKD